MNPGKEKRLGENICQFAIKPWQFPQLSITCWASRHSVHNHHPVPDSKPTPCPYSIAIYGLWIHVSPTCTHYANPLLGVEIFFHNFKNILTVSTPILIRRPRHGRPFQDKDDISLGYRTGTGTVRKESICRFQKLLMYHQLRPETCRFTGSCRLPSHHGPPDKESRELPFAVLH